MPVVNCEIDKISKLNAFIHQIEMTPSSNIKFKAGQYLKLMLPNNKASPFSIVSSPSRNNIVIQVSSAGDDVALPPALTFCFENKRICIEAGLGDAYFQSTRSQPIILFAAGSGFSYAKSIADHLAETNHLAPVTFYWGVRRQDSLYAEVEMAEWERKSPGFRFIPVVKEPDAAWQGRKGSVLEALLADIDDLSDYDIYLAGRFDLMPQVKAALLKQRAVASQMFSDAFSYI